MDMYSEEGSYDYDDINFSQKCYYCGNDNQESLVQCVHLGCGQYFCNSEISDNPSSHIFYHLQVRQHNQVEFLTEDELKCFECGNKNIFTLIFLENNLDYEGNSDLTIICRNNCYNNNPEYRTYLWKPVIFDQAIDSFLLSNFSSGRIVTEEEINVMEHNLSCGLVKNPLNIGPSNIKKIKLKYDSVEDYCETFELLLELENAYDEEEENKSQEREIIPAWSDDLRSFKFTWYDDQLHMKVNDELCIKGPNFKAEGLIKRISTSQEISVLLLSSSIGNRSLTRLTIKQQMKNVAHYRMLRALKSFRRLEEKLRNFILGFDVELPPLYVEPREDYSVPGLPKLNESQNKAVKAALDSPFCLIQGPPGTGKTVTTASIVYHLSRSINRPSQYKQINAEMQRKQSEAIEKLELVASMYDELERRQVLFEAMKKNNKQDPNLQSKIELFEKFIKNWELKIEQQEKEREEIRKVIEVIQFKLGNLEDDSERKRILVTAPSNIAVDHLVSKIKETGLQVVRFYSRSKEESKGELEKYSFHYLFEKKLEESPEYKSLKDMNNLKKSSGLSKSEKAVFTSAERKIRDEILKEVHVVCCTCIGALDHRLQLMRFSKVIIDEACQSREPESLIPLLTRPDQVIMVGDHYQLGPVIKCKQVEDVGLGNSLFQRMVDLGRPTYMLEYQYRMHPQISEFPCQVFYENMLKDGIKSCDRIHDQCRFHWPGQKPVFFCHTESPEEFSSNGKSYLNRQEAEIVVGFVNKIGVCADIGIITFYDAQRVTILQYMRGQNYPNVEVASVDSFQGREKDFIILSCVRSSYRGGVGFLGNYRRLNVAITRAKYGLIICGNVNTLLRSPIWRTLIGYYRNKGQIFSYSQDGLVPFHNFEVGRTGFNVYREQFPYLDALAYEMEFQERQERQEDILVY